MSPGSWGYLSGQASQAAQAIANTDDDPLYQSERYNLTRLYLRRAGRDV